MVMTVTTTEIYDLHACRYNSSNSAPIARRSVRKNPTISECAAARVCGACMAARCRCAVGSGSGRCRAVSHSQLRSSQSHSHVSDSTQCVSSHAPLPLPSWAIPLLSAPVCGLCGAVLHPRPAESKAHRVRAANSAAYLRPLRPRAPIDGSSQRVACGEQHQPLHKQKGPRCHGGVQG